MGPASKPACCQFCHILLVKASYKASPTSRGRENNAPYPCTLGGGSHIMLNKDVDTRGVVNLRAFVQAVCLLCLFISLSLAVPGLGCCVRAFSRGGAWAPHCGGFSCGARALGVQACFSSCSTQAPRLRLSGCRVQAQWSWHMGLAAPRHVESSQTRD